MERTAADEVAMAELPSTSGAHWANRDRGRRTADGRSAPFRRPPALNSFPAEDPESLSPSAYLPQDTGDVPATSWFAGQAANPQQTAKPGPGTDGWAPEPAAPETVPPARSEAQPRTPAPAPEFGPAPPSSPGRISFGVSAGPISPYQNGSVVAPTSPAALPAAPTSPAAGRPGREARGARQRGRDTQLEDTGIGQLTGPGREIRPHRASRREPATHDTSSRLQAAPSRQPGTGSHQQVASIHQQSTGAHEQVAAGYQQTSGTRQQVAATHQQSTGSHQLVAGPQHATGTHQPVVGGREQNGQSGPQSPPDEAPRRSRALVFATVALSAVVLAGGAVAGVSFFSGDDQGLKSVLQLGAGGTVKGKTATAPLDGRKTAAFELVTGTTKVGVSVADLGGDLFKVTAADDSGMVPSPEVSKDKVQLQLAPDGNGSTGDVRVVLSSKVRWSLRFTGGADEQVVDLTGGRVAGIDVIGGSRRFQLTLPKASGTVPVHVTGAIDDFSIESPPGSPVRVQVQGGAKTVAAGTVTLRDVKPGSTLTPKDWKVADRYDVTAAARVTLLSVDSAE